MKVVLFGLNGSFNHSNLAIRRLRSALDVEELEVKLIEAGLRDADSSILESLVAENADIYGFSAYIWNIKRLLPIAEDLKSVLPQTFVVFGGPEMTYASERFNALDFIDCLVLGAGESAILSVCRAVKSGKSVSRIIDGGKTPLSEGILYRTNEQIKTTLYYESAVGCPFSCAFCLSSATCGVEAKSAETTLAELYEFESVPGDFIIKFVDRTFNFNIKRANSIWEGLLDPKYTKRYQFEICAELLNEESFNILGKFPRGKIQLEAGLQSTNSQTLASVARHLDSKRTIDACRRIKEQGNVHVHVDLIAGLPYEDYASFKKSFNDAYFCCEQLQLGFLKLLHGTSLREKADEYGYRFDTTEDLAAVESAAGNTVAELLSELNNGIAANSTKRISISKDGRLRIESIVAEGVMIIDCNYYVTVTEDGELLLYISDADRENGILADAGFTAKVIGDKLCLSYSLTDAGGVLLEYYTFDKALPVYNGAPTVAGSSYATTGEAYVRYQGAKEIAKLDALGMTADMLLSLGKNYTADVYFDGYGRLYWMLPNGTVHGLSYFTVDENGNVTRYKTESGRDN